MIRIWRFSNSTANIRVWEDKHHSYAFTVPQSEIPKVLARYPNHSIIENV